MRITIEPTEADAHYRSISISTKGDDLPIVETMDLVKDAIRAWGFSDAVIEEYWK